MLKKYFNKILLYNVLIAIGMLLILLLVVQAGLKSYTRHGQGIPVPDLKGKKLEEAEEILKKTNLEFQIMDSVYDNTKPPLSIVEQNPKAKSKVKEGRTIYLTINATRAPMVQIPDLVGRSSLKYAKMQLESYGLKVGELIYRPDPHLNAVIGMEVAGRPVTKNSPVPRGTTINLILGDGLGGGRIAVPYLIGLTYAEGRNKLSSNSLNLGAVVVEGELTDTTSAIIFKQVPAYGADKTIRMGEPIDIFIAKQLPSGITVDTSLYEPRDTLSNE